MNFDMFGEPYEEDQIAGEPSPIAQPAPDMFAGLDPRVAEYMRKKQEAQAGSDRANMVANAGGVADSLANAAFGKPTVYQNNWQQMGQAPKIQAGPEVKSDFTSLQKQAEFKLNNAKSDASEAAKAAFEQKKAEMMQQVQAKKAEEEQRKFDLTYAQNDRKIAADTASKNAYARAVADAKNRELGLKETAAANDPLSSIPKELRDNYLSSEGKIKEYDDAMMAVDPLIDKAAAFTYESHMTPKAAGGGDFKSLEAKIAGAIMNRVPGIRSDADFRNIVVPMIPQPSDPPEIANAKAKDLKAYLRSNRPVNEVGNVYKPKPKVEEKKTTGATGSWDGLDDLSDEELAIEHSKLQRK